MGVVYAAYDPGIDRRVALKFLNADRAERGQVQEARLLREAQAMGRLSHPNVAVAYEVGLFGQHVFLAMEFVDGQDLRTWLSRRDLTSSEILAVFLAAGRGLAAAHAAGIIHRDFKPANVLVDKHDRPRVTDFGLSRATEDGGEVGDLVDSQTDAELSPGDHLAARLTRTGAVLGTPSYMSPEQHVGDRVDERSDQFSFCVALYEALYQAHPYGETPSLPGQQDLVAGKPVVVPTKPALSRRFRRALERGLHVKPADRFSSMDALLSELSHRPTFSRRYLAAAIVLVGLLGAGSYAAIADTTEATAGPHCDAGETRMEGVWGSSRRRLLREAFERSAASGAEKTWSALSAILDKRATAWSDMYDAACAATHLDGTQSAAILDLRTECLERKRQELKGLVDVLSDQHDAKIFDQALVAAESLSQISGCADVSNLRAVVPLPEDEKSRARVATVRQQMNRSLTLYELGKYEQGRDQLLALKEEAHHLRYAPLVAEVTSALGNHLSVLGKMAEAEGTLFEAADQAVRGGDRSVEAETWIHIVINYSRLGRVPEADLAARMAVLAVNRANGDSQMRARLMNNLGAARYTAGKFEEAFDDFRRSADLASASFGRMSVRYANAVGNTGATLIELGRVREALSYLEESLAVRRAILRPDHVDISYSLNPLGSAYLALGMAEKGREMFKASLAIRQKEYGPEHPETTFTLVALAQAEAGRGNYGEALKMFEEGLAIQKRVLDPHDVFLGSTYLEIGETQRLAGLHRDAERSLRSVLEHNRAAGAPEHPNGGHALLSLGLLQNERRLFAGGLRDCRRALSLLTKHLRQNRNALALVHGCIGAALLGSGDIDGARKALTDAAAGLNDRDTAPSRAARVRFDLARALWSLPNERAQARILARRSHDLLSSAEGDHRVLLTEVSAWIRTHDAQAARSRSPH